MPDLNDFYVFKTTSSDKGYSGATTIKIVAVAVV